MTSETIPKSRLDECPEGLFWFNGALCFKSEYATMTSGNPVQPDAYVVASGEYFWGGAETSVDRSALMVEPIPADTIEALSAERDAMRDDASIGKSLMAAIASIQKEPGPYADWTPAEDPAEIVTYLFEDLTQMREALTEISSPTQTLNLLWWQERARYALSAEVKP